MNSGRKLAGTVGTELSVQEREEAAAARRSLRLKEQQRIDMEEQVQHEQQVSKEYEDLRRKERLLDRSRSRDGPRDGKERTMGRSMGMRGAGSGYLEDRRSAEQAVDSYPDARADSAQQLGGRNLQGSP